MQLTVRMDDITPDMDWEKFWRFKGILDKAGIKPLIGVVPCNQDKKLMIMPKKEEFWEIIRELAAEGWTVAQHGHCHVYTTKKSGVFPLNAYSEFAGLSFDEQIDKLERGKAILEENGINTDIFMAPAHSYDKKTLKALKACGFTKVTDGFGEVPYVQDEIHFLPISFSQKQAFETERKGYATIVFHTNMMQEKDFVYYEKLLIEKKNFFIPYSDYLKISPVSRGVIGRWKEWNMAKAKHILVRLKK